MKIKWSDICARLPHIHIIWDINIWILTHFDFIFGLTLFSSLFSAGIAKNVPCYILSILYTCLCLCIVHFSRIICAIVHFAFFHATSSFPTSVNTWQSISWAFMDSFFFLTFNHVIIVVYHSINLENFVYVIMCCHYKKFSWMYNEYTFRYVYVVHITFVDVFIVCAHQW